MAEDLAGAFQLAEQVLIGQVDRLQAVINEAWRGCSGGHGERGGGGQRPREPRPIDHDPGLLAAVMKEPIAPEGDPIPVMEDHHCISFEEIDWAMGKSRLPNPCRDPSHPWNPPKPPHPLEPEYINYVDSQIPINHPKLTGTMVAIIMAASALLGLALMYWSP